MPLILEYKGNNLRHQHGDKYIAVTFCRIYAKLAKYEKCRETIIFAQNVSSLVGCFTVSSNWSLSANRNFMYFCIKSSIGTPG